LATLNLVKDVFDNGNISQWQERFDDELATTFNQQAGKLLKLFD
jgi:hypothetical protein